MDNINYYKDEELFPNALAMKIIVYYEGEKYLPFLILKTCSGNEPGNEKIYEGHICFNPKASIPFSCFNKEQINDFFEENIKDSKWIKKYGQLRAPYIGSFNTRKITSEELINEVEYIDITKRNLLFRTAFTTNEVCTVIYGDVRFCSKISDFPPCHENGLLRVRLKHVKTFL